MYSMQISILFSPHNKTADTRTLYAEFFLSAAGCDRLNVRALLLMGTHLRHVNLLVNVIHVELVMKLYANGLTGVVAYLVDKLAPVYSCCCCCFGVEVGEVVGICSLIVTSGRATKKISLLKPYQ